MIHLRICEEKTEWDKYVRQLNGHPLQLWAWGEVKARHGWKASRVVLMQDNQVVGGAQIVVKPLPSPFGTFSYIPRGPFGAVSNEGREAIAQFCKKELHSIVVTGEPDTDGALTWKGWRKSSNRILMARTAVLNLEQTEDEMQASMSKKTRQYIRKAAKEGTTVRQAENRLDIDKCLAIYKQTANRANFALHDDQYYYDIFEQLGSDSPVFMAEHNGSVVAFLWPIVTPEIAFELYGGLNDAGQELRSNYHLKWTVIQRMKQQGVARYDVNGLLNDGVSAFKQGFIPDETIMSGTFDRPLSPLYWLWSIGLPLMKKVVRLVKR